MLKILEARLQQYMNHELPDVQPGFRNGSRIKLPTSIGLLKNTTYGDIYIYVLSVPIHIYQKLLSIHEFTHVSINPLIYSFMF